MGQPVQTAFGEFAQMYQCLPSTCRMIYHLAHQGDRLVKVLIYLWIKIGDDESWCCIALAGGFKLFQKSNNVFLNAMHRVKIVCRYRIGAKVILMDGLCGLLKRCRGKPLKVGFFRAGTTQRKAHKSWSCCCYNSESKQWNRYITQKLVCVHFTRHSKSPVYLYLQAFNVRGAIFLARYKNIFCLSSIQGVQNSLFLQT